MRFDYDGTRQSGSRVFSGLFVHSFYLHATTEVFNRLVDRAAVADEARRWCMEHIPDRFVCPTVFAFEIFEGDAAMEFRLRWC